jgi:hypothetical protein
MSETKSCDQAIVMSLFTVRENINDLNKYTINRTQKESVFYSFIIHKIVLWI